MEPTIITPGWMKNPPTTLEAKLTLLKQKKHLLNDNTEMGEFLRALLQDVKEIQKRGEDEARSLQPLAFFKPSYEQMLILNTWMYGISLIFIFSANRIGKTVACIINFLLWILPNNPKWKIFRPYRVGDLTDSESADNPNKGKLVQVFPRPDISIIKKIKDISKKRPQSIPAPNPRLPHYEKQNRLFLQWLQTQLAPEHWRRAWPNPAWNKHGVIWYGGPDHEHFKNIIMPLWREYVPKAIIEQDSESGKVFTFVIPHPNSAVRKTEWKWIGKSFESSETKWSSGAVDAILLTEGVVPQIWKEIKARFKDPGIGSYDFTPYEPANAGAATALAQKIMKGSEPVPLAHFVFDKFSVYTAPRHIMSQDKFDQLITAYSNDSERPARLEGKFYSSSALVLSHLDRQVHLLPWSFADLRRRYPTLQLFRGIDPGMDHPSACAWGALLPTNQWVIYRMMCEPNLTISQRCEKIAHLSNNKLAKVFWGPNPQDFYRTEVNPSPSSELFVANPIDYHVFKRDETTGRSMSLQYQLAGLNITESVHTGPEERAQILDDLLEPNEFYPHIAHNPSVPPGPRVFFLKNGPGVMEAILKWEELYWDRKRSGDDKGSPKDKVPTHGDDELDATCYLVASPFKWTNYRPSARVVDDTEPEPQLVQASRLIQSLPNSDLDENTLQSLQKQKDNPYSNQVVHFGSNNQQEDDEDERLDRIIFRGY